MQWNAPERLFKRTKFSQTSQVFMENPAPDMLYSHRAKPYSSELELRLTSRELLAEKGKSQQRYPLGEIERIRLSYAPRNIIKLAFRCEIRAKDGASVFFENFTWRSLVAIDRQDDEYHRFVSALIERASTASPGIRLESGISPLRFAMTRLLGIALIAALVLATGYFAFFIGQLANSIHLVYAGLAVTSAFYLANWLREFLGRNRPGSFPAGAIPESVIPARKR
jgi:hypothetical protein